MRVDLSGRAGEVFLLALEHEGSAREDYLSEACGADAGLRAQVDHLLTNHHEDELVEASAVRVEGPAPRPARMGEGTELLQTGALVSRVLGGGNWRVVTLVVVVAVVAGLGLWARREVLSEIDAQTRAGLERRSTMERALVNEWINGQLTDVEAACRDLDLVEAARDLRAVEILLNSQAPERHAALTAGDLQEHFWDALQHVLTRDDLEGYALIHHSGVVLAAMNQEFVGQRTPLAERVQGAETQAEGKHAGARFKLPTNPESWDVARARLAGKLEELDAMAWVEAPVLDTELEGAGTDARLGTLVLGSPAAEFARILSTGEGAGGGSSESYAVDADGFVRSKSKFADDYVQALRERDIEPVWLEGEAPASVSTNRVQSFKLLDPGGPIVDLPRGEHLLAVRTTRIFEDISRCIPLEKRAELERGVRMEPYRDYRGVEVIGAWAWWHDHRFALITEVDASEAFAAHRYVDLILLLLLALLGSILAVGLSSSFAVVRLRKRISDGTQLGPYTLVERIGEGGLGEVYLARHALLKRPTAIKILKREAVDAESLARFEREVQLASQLTNPHTIAVYDFGRTLEGTFYCAMEFLDGMNLAELVRENGDLDPARVVHILRGACASLGEAHARGLVHRDVKPANLMLCNQGGQHDLVKLLDFGLVKDLDDGSARTLTQATRISGTLLYLAPERLRAPESVDGRTDLYSLGAVAFFLLTGRHHITARTDVDLLDCILREAPRPPSEFTDQPIPPALDQLVVACLSKEMDGRPADTAELLARLDRIEGLEPWTEEQAARWWKAHRG